MLPPHPGGRPQSKSARRGGVRFPGQLNTMLKWPTPDCARAKRVAVSRQREAPGLFPPRLLRIERTGRVREGWRSPINGARSGRSAALSANTTVQIRDSCHSIVRLSHLLARSERFPRTVRAFEESNKRRSSPSGLIVSKAISPLKSVSLAIKLASSRMLVSTLPNIVRHYCNSPPR